MTRILALNRRYWPASTLLLLAAIVYLSLNPLPELPIEPPGSDKTHHFLAYAALALPVALARPRGWGWWPAGFLALSAAIELIQPYVNRYGEWADLMANGAGLAMGVALATALRALLRSA
jgi:VanZ family protein